MTISFQVTLGWLSLLAWCAPGAAAQAAVEDPPPSLVPHEHVLLSNGMHVVLNPDAGARWVVVDLVYGLGSRDDPSGRSGWAALVAQLIRDRLDAVSATLVVDGVRSEVTLGRDRLSLRWEGPADALPRVLEAPRVVLGAPVGPLDPARIEAAAKAIPREAPADHDPYGDGSLDILLHELMYPVGHPYHHPMSGRADELAATSVSELDRFVRRLLRANNATLTVAGFFDAEAWRSRLESWFGRIPPGAEVRHEVVQGAQVEIPRRFTLHDPGARPRLVYAYHTGGWFGPGDAECDLLVPLLAHDGAGRLHRRLVEQDGLALAVTARHTVALMGGLFTIDVQSYPGVDLEAVGAAIDAELARLIEAEPTDSEVARARARVLSAWRAERDDLAQRATLFSRYVQRLGHPDGFLTDEQRYVNTSARSVRRWAKGVLTPERRLVIEVRPELEVGPEGQAPVDDDAAAFVPVMPQIVERPSGLSTWWVDWPGTQSVELRLVLTGGRVAQDGTAGLAELTGRLLRAGSGALSAGDFAAAVESLGASFTARVEAWGTVLSMRVPVAAVEQAAVLLHDAVTDPRFDERDFERERRSMSWETWGRGPREVARARAEAAHYGTGHPLAADRFLDQLSLRELTRDHVALFHASSAQPRGAALILVGDLEPDVVERVIDVVDRDWPDGSGFDVTSLPRARSDGVRVLGVPHDAGSPGAGPADADRVVAHVLLPASGGHGPSQLTARLLAALLDDEHGPVQAELRARGARQVSARYEPRRTHGLLGIDLQWSLDDTAAVLDGVMQALGRVRRGEVDAAAAARAQGLLRHELLAAYASPAALAELWAGLWLDGALPVVEAAFHRALPLMGAEQLARSGRALVPGDELVIVLVGDGDRLEARLEGVSLGFDADVNEPSDAPDHEAARADGAADEEDSF